MLTYTKRAIGLIDSIIIDSEFSICVLHSDRGRGKSTTALQFAISNNYQYIEITKPSIHTNHLSSISNALGENRTDYNYLYNRAIDILNSDSKNAIIFYESELYPEELIRFISDLSNYSVSNSVNNMVFLFIANKTYYQPFWDKYFSKFKQYVNYISFDKWEKGELLELFDTEYPNCKYNLENITKVIDISFSNPEDFISNLEELKRKSIFKRGSDGIWNLGTFNIDVLSNRTGKIVKDRYDKLDKNLKSIIQRASIIGKEFDKDTLEDPLGIIYAQKLLLQIEDISQLIYKILPNDSFYCFENDEVYLSIDGYIEEEDRTKWNIALAQYFASKVKYEYSKLDEQKVDELLRKTAYYFNKSKDYKNAIAFYMKLISRCFAYSNYNQVIILVNELRKMPSDKLAKGILKIALVYSIESCEVLCNFEEALRNYYEFDKYAKVNEHLLSWGVIKKTYYNYSTNKVPESYKMLSFIKDDNTLISSANARLYINGFSMLSAIEETIGINDYETHFNYALSLSKKFNIPELYYSLLRKVNSVHKGEIGIKLMYEAYQYFQGNNRYKFAMTAHNIGSEYIYQLDGVKTLKYLIESEAIFRELGSIGQLASLNSIAIYKMLFEHDFKGALLMLEKININSLDDFEKLAILNNIATCNRKLGRLDLVEDMITEIKKINDKSGNEYPWYKECSILQNAYLQKAYHQYDKALFYFLYYIKNKFGIVKPNKVSVIKNIVYLSDLLDKPLTKEVNILKNAYDKCGQSLYENDLMFSEIMFWE